MKNTKKRNTIIAFVLLIIIILLSIFLMPNLFNSIEVLEEEEVEAFLMVGKNFGIAINGTAIVFGKVPPGSSGSKNVELKNDYEHDVKIQISSRGDINKFLIVSENNFILKPNENKNITFTANVPLGTTYGNYTGKVTIRTLRP